MEGVRYLSVGKILNAHGNRGFIKVKPLTDFPERLLNMEKVLVFDGKARKIFHVQEASGNKGRIIMQFKGVSDREEAEKFKGTLLQIHREQAMELPPDSFYIFEVLGCRVFTVKGEFLGEVKDVIQTGANDVYVVEEKNRGKPLLIPALKKVVQSLDPKAQVMEVLLPEGLEEIDGVE